MSNIEYNINIDIIDYVAQNIMQHGERAAINGHMNNEMDDDMNNDMNDDDYNGRVDPQREFMDLAGPPRPGMDLIHIISNNLKKDDPLKIAEDHDENNNFELALEYYLKAFKDISEYSIKYTDISKKIANLYYKNNLKREALPYYEICIKKNTYDDQVLYHTASCCEVIEEYKNAMDYYIKLGDVLNIAKILKILCDKNEHAICCDAIVECINKKLIFNNESTDLIIMASRLPRDIILENIKKDNFKFADSVGKYFEIANKKMAIDIYHFTMYNCANVYRTRAAIRLANFYVKLQRIELLSILTNWCKDINKVSYGYCCVLMAQNGYVNKLNELFDFCALQNCDISFLLNAFELSDSKFKNKHEIIEYVCLTAIENNYYDANVYLGDYYLSEKQYDPAEKCYKNGLNYEITKNKAMIRLKDFYNKHNPVENKQNYKTYLNECAKINDPSSLKLVGYDFEQLGHYEKATEYYEIGQTYGDKTCTSALGRLSQKQGKVNDAINKFVNAMMKCDNYGLSALIKVYATDNKIDIFNDEHISDVLQEKSSINNSEDMISVMKFKEDPRAKIFSSNGFNLIDMFKLMHCMKIIIHSSLTYIPKNISFESFDDFNKYKKTIIDQRKYINNYHIFPKWKIIIPHNILMMIGRHLVDI